MDIDAETLAQYPWLAEREARRAREAACPGHDWVREPYAGTIVHYTCTLCGAQDERDVS